MKVSVRDLFWLVLVLAMGLGWLLDHRQQRTLWAEELESANQQVQKFDRQLRVHRDKDGGVSVHRIVRGGRALTTSLK